MRELLLLVIALHGSWSSHTPIEVVSTTDSFFLSKNNFLSQADDYGRDLELDYDTVSRLASLPFHCYTVCFCPLFKYLVNMKDMQLPNCSPTQEEFPYKLSQTLVSPEGLRLPKDLHPIFFGCFDWHRFRS